MGVDYYLLLLNSGSAVVVAKAFLDENLRLDIDLSLASIGGFIVLISVAALNFVKMRREFKATKRENKVK